jgi:hypothetical protein
MGYWDSDSYYAIPTSWEAHEVPARIRWDRPTLSNWRGHGQDEYNCRSFDLPGGRKIDVAQTYKSSPGEEKWGILVLENGRDTYPEAVGMVEEVA